MRPADLLASGGARTPAARPADPRAAPRARPLRPPPQRRSDRSGPSPSSSSSAAAPAGTISGADASAYGSLLELSWQGTREVGPLCDGSTRKFLADGDTVSMRGTCLHSSGYTLGFGECAGQVLAAATLPPPPPPPPPTSAARSWRGVHSVGLMSNEFLSSSLNCHWCQFSTQ